MIFIVFNLFSVKFVWFLITLMQRDEIFCTILPMFNDAFHFYKLPNNNNFNSAFIYIYSIYTASVFQCAIFMKANFFFGSLILHN